MYLKVEPVIDYKVRALCVSPYDGHPKGCPNFRKKEICPPEASFIKDIFDMEKPIYVIYNKFDFGSHVNNMRSKHPDWSNRQLTCCLYWQGKARKQLKKEISNFLDWNKEYHVLTCPEACGVNITATMKKIGIDLEWPPKNYTYQVALGGIKWK